MWLFAAFAFAEDLTMMSTVTADQLVAATDYLQVAVLPGDDTQNVALQCRVLDGKAQCRTALGGVVQGSVPVTSFNPEENTLVLPLTGDNVTIRLRKIVARRAPAAPLTPAPEPETETE